MMDLDEVETNILGNNNLIWVVEMSISLLGLKNHDYVAM